MWHLIETLILQVALGILIAQKMSKYAKRSFLGSDNSVNNKRNNTQKFFITFFSILFILSIICVLVIIGLYFDGRFKMIVDSKLIYDNDYFGNKIIYYNNQMWHPGELDIKLLATEMFLKYLFSALFLLFISLSIVLYADNYRSSGSVVWAKFRKTFGYFLLLIVVLNIPSVLLSQGAKDNIYIYLYILIVVLLTFFCTKEYKSDECKDMNKIVQKHSKVNVTLVVFLLLIPLILIFLSVYVLVKKHNPIASYFLLFFLFTLVYYIVIIVEGKELGGENIMLLPILVKMKLFDDIKSVAECRRKLIMNVMPLMLIHVVVIVYCSLFGGENRTNGSHHYVVNNGLTMFISLIPFILTILFLIKEYSVKWIDQAKDDK